MRHNNCWQIFLLSLFPVKIKAAKNWRGSIRNLFLPWITFNKYSKEYIFILVGVLFGSSQYHCRGTKQHSIQPQQQQKNHKKMYNFKNIARLNEKRRMEPTFHFLLKNLQWVKMWICMRRVRWSAMLNCRF